jgi:hypothetical protein
MLVFSNMPEKSSTEMPDTPPLTQYVFAITNDDGFVIERKRFADNAWSGVERLTYRRK